MGVAKGQDDLLSAVNLTCDGDRLSLSISTQHLGQKENLHYYEGTKVILGYKTKEGFERKMGVEGTVAIPAGMGLWVSTTLSPDESKAIHKSIALGNRLDVQLVHPELMYDTDVKKVYSLGFTTALLAMHELCPELKS